MGGTEELEEGNQVHQRRHYRAEEGEDRLPLLLRREEDPDQAGEPDLVDDQDHQAPRSDVERSHRDRQGYVHRASKGGPGQARDRKQGVLGETKKQNLGLLVVEAAQNSSS